MWRQTFTEWFINDYLFGPNGGSNPNISGFFFDDQFNPPGATESQGNLANLGLTKEQGAQVSEYYWAHMNVVYDTLIKRGKFAWQLLWSGQKDCAYKNSYSCLGTTGTNILIDKGNCAAKLRPANINANFSRIFRLKMQKEWRIVPEKR